MKKILSIVSMLLLVSSNNINAEINSKIYRITIDFEKHGKKISQAILKQDFNTDKDVIVNSEGQVFPDIAEIEYSCVDDQKEKKCKENHKKIQNSTTTHIELIENTNQLDFKFKAKEYLGIKNNIEKYDVYTVNKLVDLKEQETVISELEHYKVKIKIEKINIQ